MPGLLRGVARVAVVSGTASAVSGRVAHRQQNRWAAQEPQQDYEQAPPPPPAPAPAADPIEQLTKLGALRDSGVLTEEEFEAQKAKLLG
jgi:hypothetical protein